MALDSDFRRCLIDMDVAGAKACWAVANPHLPQPSDSDAVKVMHMARTGAASVPWRLRAYSHRWLSERALPSQLPDALKPAAERLYPQITESVGIAVKSRFAEVRVAIEGAMRNVVEDCYANGDTDTCIVKPRMMEARRKEQIALGTKSRWGTLVPVGR